MGYSESIATLETRRAEGLLTDLEQGKGCSWTVRPGVRPADFAYKIREALWIASKHPIAYPELAKAHSIFKIEVIGPNKVQARIKRSTTEGAIIAGEANNTGLETAEKGSGTLQGTQTADSIIQHWLDNQPSNASIFFPEAMLSEPDKLRLFNWASSRGWMFFEALNGAITLQREDPKTREFAWSPEPEEEEELEDPPER
jgi:hypothetical protein